MDRVERARLVSVQQIADEMGWTRQKAVNRLWNHAWLTHRYRRGSRYDAHVIVVLQNLYGRPTQHDYLSDYLKETS